MPKPTTKHHLPKWLKWTFIGAGSMLGLFVVLFALLLFTLFGRQVAFGVPVPNDWQQTNQTGSISSFCAGSWEECGVMLRVYQTGKPTDQAESQIRTSLASKGWVVSGRAVQADSSVSLTAQDRAENYDQNAAITLRSDGRATISYVRR